MRVAKAWCAAVGLLGWLGSPDRVEAQAVAFFPQVSSIPDGVGLSATPVVSADRRYVRLSVNAGFQTVDGFMNFGIPGTVANLGQGGGGLGGIGGLGGLGGAGGGGGGGGVRGSVMGMNGPAGGWMTGGYDPGYDDYGYGVQDYGAWRPAPPRAKAPRTTRSTRSKKPLPDPTIARAKPAAKP